MWMQRLQPGSIVFENGEGLNWQGAGSQRLHKLLHLGDQG
jgi:hypothetical protein